MSTEAVQSYEEPVELGALFAKLSRRRWWIVAAVVFSTVLFVTAAFVITPVYRATTVLIPASAERNSVGNTLNSTLGQLGALGALAGLSMGSADAATEEALAVLKSHQFTDRFIAEMNLLPQLFPERWDAAANQWKTDKPAPTPARAFRYLSRLRTIKQDRKTGLVTLEIDWRDRTQAALWANELAKRINSEMRLRAIDKAQASVRFLEQELASTSTVETRDAINRLIESQIKQRMLANVTQEYSFRVVDPATPADSDDPLRPQKLLLFLLGPLVGLAFGILAVLAVDLFSGSKRRGYP